jgi:hypothetical protein
MKIHKIKGNNVFTSLLELLGVKHTGEFSSRYFNEHPHKYSLFGISRMLSDYGIENAGARITNIKEDIFNIEMPFIAHTISDFVVVYKIENDKVYYLWNGKKLTVPVSSFIGAWSGIVLLSETSSNSIEPDYKEHKKQELFAWGQKILLSLAVGLVLMLAYINNAVFRNIGLNLLLLLNIVGVYIGYLLILKQMHVHSRYADKICSLFSQSDCNNILESKAARLWGV